ncbi:MULTISPECIES: enoyl-CoA hydratase/isomerase family protein [unclassified Azospirillum]|uniref:enoyl-CoA hydratase/isomerase family protein n=1 Tax=unclassified Azospirillum TaxID=2630922 RepID=UPI000B6A0C8A|nr:MULTISPECIES: enoyl-CoA hydratase-related protein [unclassified Azospirillum]SNT07510.1 2-(1,2-epoxy-1,2-dihydrophenyl)acetyl-CoA isomerase [Azospirillum sp. RU38E]SNT22445.1 2-(1,2-epoxy-1,2-dihydrophenyl)acetyl-CoA isomerase [Azospirillum sp. RU37A]
MNEEPLLVTLDGPVATLTLNRPGVGNAIDLPLAQALMRAAIRCDQDDRVRCVVLTGAGRLFCAGGDLSAFAAAGDQVPSFLSELAGTLHMGISRLQRMAKPLLVLVNGPAAGAGLSLALIGDIVIAVRSAHFTAAYGSVGLSPDGGMSWLLPRLIGLRRAQDMIIANRRVHAEEAAGIGLITRVVEDTELVSAGAEAIRSLANAPTRAVGAARALLLDSFDGALEAHLDREARHITASAATRDCREGVAAYLGRRKPDFVGA